MSETQNEENFDHPERNPEFVAGYVGDGSFQFDRLGSFF
jgi:hypothetical protein